MASHELTPKQQRFVEVYLDCGNASEAYRQSYNCENMKPESIGRAAKKVLDNGKIAAQLDKHREESGRRIAVTLDSHHRSLMRLRDEALAAGNYSAAIRAEELLGKSTGLYTEKKEISGPSGTPLGICVIPAKAEVIDE